MAFGRERRQRQTDAGADETEFGERFIRIHRNAIVAVKFLEGLERDAQGHYQVRLRGIDDRLDVSRRHVSGLRRFIQSL